MYSKRIIVGLFFCSIQCIGILDLRFTFTHVLKIALLLSNSYALNLRGYDHNKVV